MAESRLEPGDLYRPCDTAAFRFVDTGELEILPLYPGQERAREAIEFGIDIQQQGFNVFVLGSNGLGKRTLVDAILSQRQNEKDPRYDWCYVANFDEPQKPRLLKLEAGLGRQLSKDMLQLVEDLLTALPASFSDEEYRRRRQEIEDEVSERSESAFRKLGEDASERGVTLLRTPMGYTLAPTRDGEIISPDEFAKLSKDEQKKLQDIISELQVELQEIVNTLPLMNRETAHRVKALNKEITEFTVEQMIAWLENKYCDQPQVTEYLHGVKEHAIEHAEDFLPEAGEEEVGQIGQRARSYSGYQINVIVDNQNATGRPIVFEDDPTYQNLVGRVEYISQMGTLLTDFTLIKPGSLHRANGGYLIIEADKLLRHVYAWEGLKRALRAGEIKIASLQDALSLNSTISLEPECIPLDIKVIMLGEPVLYYLLNHYDPDFGKIFQVAADFAPDFKRSKEQQELYARMIATLQTRYGLLPLDPAAVGRTIEFAARLAGDQEKLSLDQDKMRRLLQEADHWARKQDRNIVCLADINTALERDEQRHNQLSERFGEQILRGIKLIDTAGSKAAQVNGLSVIQLDSHNFGLPTRITATARLGDSGIIDIEREAKLGGDIHSKGVMILSAFLAQQYAREQPLPLAASLVFEQSYGGVDGDSATCAELCCLLSAIADIPLRQDLAVTGSMNQLGEVQAIGGVNEKIEGFFRICQSRQLNGHQGVIIPAANRSHLMLNQEVRDAVRDEQFSIYTAQRVEDVMALLSGLPAGEADENGLYPAGSFNRLVCDSLANLRKQHKLFRRHSGAEDGDGS